MTWFIYFFNFFFSSWKCNSGYGWEETGIRVIGFSSEYELRTQKYDEGGVCEIFETSLFIRFYLYTKLGLDIYKFCSRFFYENLENNYNDKSLISDSEFGGICIRCRACFQYRYLG